MRFDIYEGMAQAKADGANIHKVNEKLAGARRWLDSFQYHSSVGNEKAIPRARATCIEYMRTVQELTGEPFPQPEEFDKLPHSWAKHFAEKAKKSGDKAKPPDAAS